MPASRALHPFAGRNPARIPGRTNGVDANHSAATVSTQATATSKIILRRFNFLNRYKFHLLPIHRTSGRMRPPTSGKISTFYALRKSHQIAACSDNKKEDPTR